jgi:hypothetical protein
VVRHVEDELTATDHAVEQDGPGLHDRLALDATQCLRDLLVGVPKSPGALRCGIVVQVHDCGCRRCTSRWNGAALKEACPEPGVDGATDLRFAEAGVTGGHAQLEGDEVWVEICEAANQMGGRPMGLLGADGNHAGTKKRLWPPLQKETARSSGWS